MKLTRADFPEDFLFGAATAAYQIEGHAQGGAGATHWDTFAATPGNVAGAEDGSVACDHYNRFGEDLDLLRDGNFDGYRFSTSWARVLPEGRGAVNEAGLDFYDRLVDGILERGLKPFHTLYHWEMPAALSDLGGWTHPDVHKWFGDYVDVIAGRIGDRVAATATINEPWCVAFLSHFLGAHAPGLRDIRATARAMHHILKAHGEGMARLRARGQENLGIVLNFDYCQPASEAPEDMAAAATADAIFNRWFIEAITRGAYPAEAMEGFAPHMPKGWEADMEAIGAELDWLGVNYYTRHIHAADPSAPAWPAARDVPGHLATTQMGWEVYPEGLHHFLMRMHDETGGKPLYITENGMAWDDRVLNGACHDPERMGFVDLHTQAIHRALDDGANIKGFFYWSLLDNYEWAEGYNKRFGMVHVDYATQKRTPKSTYYLLRDALARG